MIHISDKLSYVYMYLYNKMSIRENMVTLFNIKAEVSRLSKELSSLRKGAKSEEALILKYMSDTNTESLKFKGLVISLREKKLTRRKKKSAKTEDMMALLEKYGVNSSTVKKSMCVDIMSALRGPVLVENSLLFKKMKKPSS